MDLLKKRYAVELELLQLEEKKKVCSQALRQAKYDLRQAEEDKLVIVITDGAPDGGPEQCRTEVLKLGKLAKVYGMAIGGGRDALENIFGSKYIGVDSLSKLPGELCKVVERNIIRR